MTGKILRISYLVAISALLASALLFFGVMYRDYEDGRVCQAARRSGGDLSGAGRRGQRLF